MHRSACWKRLVCGVFLGSACLVSTVSSEVAAAGQAQEQAAPAGLACPGLVPPGSPPDNSPGWVLQWTWEWQTFSQGISWPVGVAVDRTCNVYVADGKLNQIIKLSPIGETLARWGSSGKQAGQFDRLEGVAVDGAGNVYAADSGNDRLQKLLPTGEPALVWASEFGCRNVTVKCQVVPDAFFGTLNVTADSAGNVYVVDAHNEIQRFGPDGTRAGRWGDQGSGAGQFSQPRGLALDRGGVIYVADTLNNRVQKISADGKSLAQWDSSTSGGPMAFGQQRGVAVDADGNVYVADTDNQRLVKLGSDGSFTTQFLRCADDSNPCTRSGSGDGAGEFTFPYAVAVDGRGDVLVADTGGSRVAVLKAIPTWIRPDVLNPDEGE